MSGTFNEIDVPPTLVSFAVDVASDKTISLHRNLRKRAIKLVLLQDCRRMLMICRIYEQVMELSTASSMS